MAQGCRREARDLALERHEPKLSVTRAVVGWRQIGAEDEGVLGKIGEGVAVMSGKLTLAQDLVYLQIGGKLLNVRQHHREPLAGYPAEASRPAA